MNYNFIGNKIDETTRKYFFKKLPIIAYGADSLTKVGENDYVAVWKSTEPGGRFELPYDQNVWYLAVGGGGAGGTVTSSDAYNRGTGGGGGAGGFVEVNPQTLSVGLYTVTVGAGGLAATSQNTTPGGKGGNSIIYSEATASEIVKVIGGGGGGANSAGGDGGCGGGGSWDGVNTPTMGGSGVTGQGFAGGRSGARRFSGAGGGAGANGGNSGSTSVAQPGGVGKQSQILDTKEDDEWPYYAGGGGGGRATGSKVDTGGKGGGGTGGRGSSTAPVAAEKGEDGKGGGGGGGGRYGVGANGGSGIVIVRFLNPPSIPILKECPFDVSYGTLSGLSSEYFETGSPIVPEISVYNSKGKLLTENTDWQKILENNTWAGTASLSVVGIGSYYGQMHTNFKIIEPPYPPWDYRVSYIKSTGTQYMLANVGPFTPNATTIMEVDIGTDDRLDTNMDLKFMGYWNEGSICRRFLAWKINGQTPDGTLGSGNEMSHLPLATYPELIFKFYCDGYPKTACYLPNGTLLYNSIKKNGTGTEFGMHQIGTPVQWSNIPLFRLLQGNSTSPSSESITRGSCFIRYLKITHEGRLINHLVPCIKDGKPSIADLVTNAFYYNIGSGTFLVGERVKNNGQPL